MGSQVGQLEQEGQDEGARGGGLSYTAGQGHSGGHWGLIEGIQIFTGFSKDGPLWMLWMIRVYGAVPCLEPLGLPFLALCIHPPASVSVQRTAQAPCSHDPREIWKGYKSLKAYSLPESCGPKPVLTDVVNRSPPPPLP